VINFLFLFIIQYIVDRNFDPRSLHAAPALLGYDA
jgi:hypothetical protein